MVGKTVSVPRYLSFSKFTWIKPVTSSNTAHPQASLGLPNYQCHSNATNKLFIQTDWKLATEQLSW